MKKTSKIIFVYLSLLLLLVFINLEIPIPILGTIKTILVILIATFIPGYLFVTLFLDKTDNSEVTILSVAVSICFVILTGVLIHLLQIKINVYNILNPLWFVSSVFALALLLIKTKSPPSRKKRTKKTSKIFYLDFILVLAFFFILFYISLKTSSTGEFVELNWQFAKTQTSWDKTGAICHRMSCSLSGINKIQKAHIDQTWYDIIFLDLNYAGKYDSICIDLNHNSVYCEGEEGPFWPPIGFMINGKDYSFNLLGDSIVIFSFPRKVVNRTDFQVSYNVRSYYPDIKFCDVILTMDDEVLSQKEIVIEPDERMLIRDQIPIPEEEGWHKFEVIVSPKGTGESAKINFFFEYFREY